MGTRGLVGFKINGKYFGAYTQYDTYPCALGAKVVAFIQEKLNSHDSIAAFRQRAEGLIILDREECIKDVPEELQKRYMEYADLDVSTKSPSEWYCLLRKLQGVRILYAIESGRLGHFPNAIDFAKDSLFCEYAYFVDLDEHRLETFRGFQEKPQSNNPFGQDSKEDKYYPIARIASDAFEDLPHDIDRWVERIDQLIDEDRGEAA